MDLLCMTPIYVCAVFSVMQSVLGTGRVPALARQRRERGGRREEGDDMVQAML